MQISFVMLIFLLFSDQISGAQKSPRGVNCLRGRPPVEDNQSPRILLMNSSYLHVDGTSLRNYEFEHNIKTGLFKVVQVDAPIT